MSGASLSLNHETIEATVIELINHMEANFGHHSHTASKRRTNQLHGILWRCIQLKQKLECQQDTYIFWSTRSHMPFDTNSMLDLSEVKNRSPHILYSLWPGLVKVLSTGLSSVIQKEVVKPSSNRRFGRDKEGAEDAIAM